MRIWFTGNTRRHHRMIKNKCTLISMRGLDACSDSIEDRKRASPSMVSLSNDNERQPAVRDKEQIDEFLLEDSTCQRIDIEWHAECHKTEQVE